MKRLLLLSTFLVMTVCMASAQELTVKSMTAEPLDLSASTSPRLDKNQVPCGLVKVQLAAVGAQFSGSVIGDCEYKMGEYWVYMPKDAYLLKIRHPNFVPLTVNFRDYDIRGVESKATYVLTLLMPQIGQEVDDGMRFVALTVEPATATVYIDNQPQVLQNGSANILLSMGHHDYRAEASGYETALGSFELGNEKLPLPIRLQTNLSSLHIECPTADVEIYVNDELMGTGSWSGTRPEGNYRLEARKAGYRTQRQTVVLAKNDNKTISLPALQPIVGRLNVNYMPQDAEVWLDGKKLGTSPDIFRNVLIGSHEVEIRAKDYISKTERITVSEGQTAQLSGQLEKAITSLEMTAAQMNSLGDDYRLGKNGKTIDNAEAVKWYRKAAEQGYAIAQYNLDYSLVSGHGVEKNPTEALNWYQKAAEQGIAKAQTIVGIYYHQKGESAQAKYWFEKAAAQGEEEAKKRLEMIQEQTPTTSNTNGTNGTVLTVKSLEAVPKDLSARTQQRVDLNGTPCALVKVQTNTKGVQFEGNVMGAVENKKNEYWVYLVSGSYMMQIKHPGFLPLLVNFRDYGIRNVEPNATYELKLIK